MDSSAQLVETLRTSLGAVLREKQAAGKLVVPSGTIDRLVDELARNAAGPLAIMFGELLEGSHMMRLEHESLWTKLHNAGGRGGTLDVMLSSVLERGRMSIAARDASKRLVDAASELLECFDEGDVDAFHPDTEDPGLTLKHGVPTTVECPEDDTCECRGPAAINELARARDAARKELGQ